MVIAYSGAKQRRKALMMLDKLAGFIHSIKVKRINGQG
jgi:hypothetical protein